MADESDRDVTGDAPLTPAERQRNYRLRKKREREAAAASGLQPDGSWEPVFDGQRPPFPTGHEVSVTTGARSERRVGAVARRFEEALRAGAGTPAYLLEPRFDHAIAAWARAEAIVALLAEWLDGQDIVAAASEVIDEVEHEDRPKPGAVKRSMRSRRTMSVLDQIHRHEMRAKSLRAELGLSPGGYAKIAHDVVFTGPAQADALDRLGEAGREIRERRHAQLTAVADPA